MKKSIILLVSSFMITLVLFFSPMTVIAGKVVCEAGIHMMTQTYNRTLSNNYEHASQYGKCYVTIEEVQKVSICQCELIMTVETISKKETHSISH